MASEQQTNFFPEDTPEVLKQVVRGFYRVWWVNRWYTVDDVEELEANQRLVVQRKSLRNYLGTGVQLPMHLRDPQGLINGEFPLTMLCKEYLVKFNNWYNKRNKNKSGGKRWRVRQIEHRGLAALLFYHMLEHSWGEFMRGARAGLLEEYEIQGSTLTMNWTRLVLEQGGQQLNLKIMPEVGVFLMVVAEKNEHRYETAHIELGDSRF